MPHCKVLCVGPKRAGKSVIADFLGNDSAGSLDLSRSYAATAGCRILEFEAQSASTPRSASKTAAAVPVELWDCSGDPDFQSCWPAMMHGAIGVVLVYNPDNSAHEDEVSLWHEFFVQKAADIGDQRCLVLAHRGKLAATAGGGPPTLPLLKRCKVVTTDRDSAALIRRSFAEFVQSIA